MINRPDTIQPRRYHLLEDVEPKLGNRKPEGMELPSTVTSHQQNIDLGSSIGNVLKEQALIVQK